VRHCANLHEFIYNVSASDLAERVHAEINIEDEERKLAPLKFSVRHKLQSQSIE
jgi:hypothetical protein